MCLGDSGNVCKYTKRTIGIFSLIFFFLELAGTGKASCIKIRNSIANWQEA